jgi:hypothetical protein
MSYTKFGLPLIPTPRGPSYATTARTRCDRFAVGERGLMREKLVFSDALLLRPTLSTATAPAARLPGSGTFAVVRLQEGSL